MAGLNDGTVGIYEFAKAVGYSPHRIYELIRLGKIPAKQVGNKRVWRIRRETLEEFLGRETRV